MVARGSRPAVKLLDVFLRRRYERSKREGGFHGDGFGSGVFGACVPVTLQTKHGDGSNGVEACRCVWLLFLSEFDIAFTLVSRAVVVSAVET